MDPSLNYKAILGVAPPESSRTLINFQPSNAGPFVSGSNEKISLEISAQSYLNPNSSFVKFKARTNYRRTQVATDPNPALAIVVDGGATSFFTRATLYNQSGSVVSEIADYDFAAQHLIRSKGEGYVKGPATQAHGYHPVFAEYQPSYLPDTTGVSDLYTTASTGRLPCVINVPAGTAQAVGATNTVANDAVFAIPLAMFSGLFNTDLSLPTKYMTNGGGVAFRLDLELSNASRAIYVVPAVDLTAPQELDWGVGKVDYSFTITEVELLANMSNVGELVDMNVKQSIMSPMGIHFKFTDVTTRSDSNFSEGVNSYQIQTNKSVISLDKVVMQFRDASILTNVLRPSVSGFLRNTISSVQLSIGSNYYPSAPLRLTSSTGYNGNAYLELAQTSEQKGALTGSELIYNPSYNGKDVSGFEIGFNLGARVQSDLLNGRDTRSGGSNITVFLEKSGTTTKLHTLMIFESSAPIVLNSMGLIPTTRG